LWKWQHFFRFAGIFIIKIRLGYNSLFFVLLCIHFHVLFLSLIFFFLNFVKLLKIMLKVYCRVQIKSVSSAESNPWIGATSCTCSYKSFCYLIGEKSYKKVKVVKRKVFTFFSFETKNIIKCIRNYYSFK